MARREKGRRERARGEREHGQAVSEAVFGFPGKSAGRDDLRVAGCA